MKRTKMRKWMAVVFSGIMAISLPTMNCAAENVKNEDIISVRSIRTNEIISKLNISNDGMASINGGVNGRHDSKEVECFVVLQHYNVKTQNWEKVHTWTCRKEGVRAAVKENYRVNIRGAYRVKTESKVWRGNSVEKGIRYSKKCLY